MAPGKGEEDTGKVTKGQGRAACPRAGSLTPKKEVMSSLKLLGSKEDPRSRR